MELSSEWRWQDADELSDRIVDLYNAKIKTGVRSDQILAGLLLSYLALERTMPKEQPEAVRDLTQAVRRCLRGLMKNGR